MIHERICIILECPYANMKEVAVLESPLPHSLSHTSLTCLLMCGIPQLEIHSIVNLLPLIGYSPKSLKHNHTSIHEQLPRDQVLVRCGRRRERRRAWGSGTGSVATWRKYSSNPELTLNSVTPKGNIL